MSGVLENKGYGMREAGVLLNSNLNDMGCFQAGPPLWGSFMDWVFVRIPLASLLLFCCTVSCALICSVDLLKQWLKEFSGICRDLGFRFPWFGGTASQSLFKTVPLEGHRAAWLDSAERSGTSSHNETLCCHCRSLLLEVPVVHLQIVVDLSWLVLSG